MPQTLLSNHNIFATQCRSAQILQTMNYVSSNNLSSKYKRFTPSDCKGIRKFDSIPFTDLPFEHFYTHIQTQIKFFFQNFSI